VTSKDSTLIVSQKTLRSSTCNELDALMIPPQIHQRKLY